MKTYSIESKRKLLRIYANELGLCVGCLRNDNDGKSRYCLMCKKQNARQSAKYRKMEGRCSRCGQMNDREGKMKTCSKCYTPVKK